MQLTYYEDYIKFINNLSHKVIKLPYGTDLTNFGTKLTTLESGGNYEYVINEIEAINLYLGIDDYIDLHTDKKPKDIIREKNEKFFQYYRTTDENNNLSGFGVKVQTYDDTYKGDLIRIDKKNNLIKLGYDESEYKSYTTKFETNILLYGFIQIYNTTGLQISSKRSNERTTLRCDDGGVYFMDYDTPSSGDIFFPKGLRFKSEESLKIQKPYTSYQSGVNNEITIPYGIDFN
jgi:hypothetical protein